jgi:cell division protein FtsB
MPTAAQRIGELEAKVRFLEVREQLITADIQRLLLFEQRTLSEADKRREENAKQKDEVAKLVTTTAVHQTEIAELKKHREHWSQRVWQIVAGLLLAAAAGVIGYLLKR